MITWTVGARNLKERNPQHVHNGAHNSQHTPGTFNILFRNTYSTKHTHCSHPHTKPGKRLSFFWVPLYLHDAWLKRTQVLCHHKQDGDRPAPKNLPHCEKKKPHPHSVKLWIQSNCQPMNPIKLNLWTQSKHEQADKEEEDQNRREKKQQKNSTVLSL